MFITVAVTAVVKKLTGLCRSTVFKQKFLKATQSGTQCIGLFYLNVVLHEKETGEKEYV